MKYSVKTIEMQLNESISQKFCQSNVFTFSIQVLNLMKFHFYCESSLDKRIKIYHQI